MQIRSWLTTAYVRHFPLSPAGEPRPLCIEAALNERFSLQVALRMEGAEPQPVRVEVSGPQGWAIRVRRIGFVPVLHHNTPIESEPTDVEGLGFIPGYVPDPLYDEDTLLLPAHETHAFWIDVRPGEGATPGEHRLRVAVIPGQGEAMTHEALVRLYDVVIQPRQGFDVTHWFYNDALIDWYKTDQFDERFWSILPNYIRNVVEHGQNTLYVPVFTPPLDGVKTPSQLLIVEKTGEDTYRLDWRDVRRYVALAKSCGVTRYEWCHFFTQWGAKYAPRIYHGQGKEERLLWDPTTAATSDTYRRFLAQFMPELRRFLDEERIADASFFHVSDEPHGAEHLAQYRQDRALLKELAPWMKVMDALTEIEFARQGLTDMPIPSIRTALDFVAEGLPCWCYYCCGPRGEYINRLLDTPLSKIAMHGFLFYRWPFQGFLHWGYNYWYKSQTRQLIDPYTVQDGLRWHDGWAYGDTFVVYPGPDGPIDALRWEIFGQGLQDYALLQTLGIDRDDPLLKPVKSFTDFPKTETWRRETRSALLKRAQGRK